MNTWELYSSDANYAQATAAIDAAWEAAKLLSPEAPAQERAYKAEQHVYQTLRKWSKVGALDTEPLAILREKVRKHFGVEGNYI